MSNPSPRPWQEATASELKQIKGVCLDIDETLSTRGKLTGEAYQSLWALKEAGFYVVPVTGRPAGWCDHIARFWPVDAVVGENGAFSFFMKADKRGRINTPGAEENPKIRLDQLAEQVRAEFPDAQWASDQAYREYDLAIDICEDVPAWQDTEVKKLVELCVRAGAHAKVSSVHVNAWFGDYDKRRGIEYWLEQGAPGLQAPAPEWQQWIFIGDSPNDEPMFASFASSVGVANLKNYLSELKHPPTWLTEAESGAGFEEMARRLIQVKSAG